MHFCMYCWETYVCKRPALQRWLTAKKRGFVEVCNKMGVICYTGPRARQSPIVVAQNTGPAHYRLVLPEDCSLRQAAVEQGIHRNISGKLDDRVLVADKAHYCMLLQNPSLEKLFEQFQPFLEVLLRYQGRKVWKVTCTSLERPPEKRTKDMADRIAYYLGLTYACNPWNSETRSFALIPADLEEHLLNLKMQCAGQASYVRIQTYRR